MKPLRLKTGDLGDDVARLHEQLALYGVDVSPEERKRKFFGPSTREAVRVFQRTHGLDPSGEVCNQTAALLSSPPLGVSTVPNSMRIRFGIGETGTFVERLHRVLMSEGHAIERNELDRCEFGASTLAAHSRSVLDTTLNSAVTSNILPASYTDVQESELNGTKKSSKVCRIRVTAFNARERSN
ncbi:peptidoglycan-binding domain-containing protein [Nostoc sp.]|uniref:peptidoglycan-binding domain-containing protein n=1 Tax=Nostoc sp. TaxID=1180 RepID=UPI003FA580E6